MKKLYSKLIFMLIFFISASSSIFSAPHNGDRFTLLQPDKSEVAVKVWGDEFYQRVESLDGYTLIKDSETGWICYATLSDDEENLISTGIHYNGEELNSFGIFSIFSNSTPDLEKHIKLSKEVVTEKANKTRQILNGDSLESSPMMSINSMSSTSGPTGKLGRVLTGNKKGITLLIDFSDDEATISMDEIDDYLNKVGYNNYSCNGSIRDYFSDVSGGALIYTNHITAYYRADHPKSYYTDETISYGTRARELILEALNYLEDETGFDFSTLSTDENNRILAINAFYAGNTQNSWAKGLWPHKSGMYDTFAADGVTSGQYQITNIGTSLKMRTFAHENGHMLFNWADLYDYGADSKGIGHYCLMGYGGNNSNPVPPNPAFRQSAGWETAVDITDSPANSTFTITANSYTTYRYSHPSNPCEYFLIESRVKEGRNTYLRDEGLAIWHIDEEGSNAYQEMTEQKHYRVSIEQADGLFSLEKNINYGGSNDFFHSGDNDSFNDSTLPDAKWWDGTDSGLDISNISGVASTMSFIQNNENEDYDSNYDQVYVRGTNNSWGTSVMTLVDDNRWEITGVQFNNGDASGGPRFKFDIHGDWTFNFGDNNNDGYAEQTGDDILVSNGSGTYTITFNDQTNEYTVEKENGGAFQKVYDNVYIRGTNNNWGTSAMTLVADNSWKITGVQFNNGDGSGGPRFKFDIHGDWTFNFGDNNNDGYADQTGGDISINSGAGTYTITFNDSTKEYTITQENSTGFTSVYDKVYYRGTSNGWTFTEMKLIANNLWEVEINTGNDANQSFKFDIYNDWTLNFGDNNNDMIGDQEGSNISLASNKIYKITFNDNTKAYTLTIK